jgi:thioester reductase-like protein
MYSFLHSLYELRCSAIGQAAAAAECAAVLGEQCSTVNVGGAVAAPQLLLWMRQLWGDKVVDGYGCTECGSIAHNGVLCQHVRVIVEPEEEQQAASEPQGDGSAVGVLWVHTRNCATAYVNSEVCGDFMTVHEASLTGEPSSIYYNTGDRVRFWAHRKRLQVIGRAKSKLRMSNATFLDADAVQTAVSLSDKGFYDIGNVLITCRSCSTIVVAVVQIRSTFRMCAAMEQELLDEMQLSCELKRIPLPWIPRHVVLDSELWTVANGCTTASGKLCRWGIEARVAQRLDVIFETASDPQAMPRTTGIKAPLTSHTFTGIIMQCTPSCTHLDPTVSLPQNGCDSISIARLTASLRNFNTMVPISTSALHSRPISDLISLYCADSHSSDLRGVPAAPLIAVAELDASLPPDLLLPMLPPPSDESQKAVFLTGASGFLGIHILSEIMQQPQRFDVFCLVRGEGEEEALARLQRQAAAASLHMCWDRVRVVVGDLSLPQFGLSTSEFASLASKISMIIHNGALVHWLKDYHQLRQSNVVGTHTCARLAHAAAVKSFVFISSSSSITPAETKSAGTPGASALLPLPVAVNMSGYAASKRVAEVFLCKFVQQHPAVALSIVRPATIISSPLRPSYNLHDAFSRYIQSCFLLKAVPLHASVRLHFVTVDFVAQCTVESLLDGGGARGSLLNILCDTGVPLTRVSHCIRSACSLQIESLPLPDWLRALRSGCPQPLQPLLHIFGREAFPWSSTCDVSKERDGTVILQALKEEAVEQSALWVAANMSPK